MAQGVIQEPMAKAIDDAKRALGGLAEKLGKPSRERRLARLGAKIAGEIGGAVRRGAEHAAALIVGGARLGDLGELGQDREPLLGNPPGRRRIETAGTVLDGVEPVAGEGLAGLKSRMVKFFRRK